MTIDHFNEKFTFVRSKNDLCIGWCYLPEKTFQRTIGALKELLPPQTQVKALRFLNWDLFTYEDLAEKALVDGFYLSVGGDMHGMFMSNMAKLFNNELCYEAHKGNYGNRTLAYKVQVLFRTYLEQKIAKAVLTSKG